MQILHDRATRGEVLSETEETQLKTWYELQDKLESELLNKKNASDILSKNKIKIDATLTEIAEFVSNIQKISTENERLRRENEVLREKIAESFVLETV